MGRILHTDDFAADHSRLIARGVGKTEEPRTVPYGTVVTCRERYGNLWDIIQHASRPS